MIPTIIVSHKRDTHIAKGMRATMNKSTSIMKIVEPDIHLTKGTGLDSLKGNPLFITQEVLKHIPNARKRYLMIRQRFDCRNGQVTVPSVRQFHHHVRHQLTLINLDSLEAPRDERAGINEVESHLRALISGGESYCRRSWGFLWGAVYAEKEEAVRGELQVEKLKPGTEGAKLGEEINGEGG